MSLECPELLTAGGVPQNRRPVLRPGKHLAGVRAERHSVDIATMSLEGTELLAAGRVPQHGRQVLTGSADLTAMLWDAASGQKLRAFQGHSSDVHSMAVKSADPV